MKGMRVQSIIRELRGEKIDIIEFSEEITTFAEKALQPAKVSRVSITDLGEKQIEVIVDDSQLSLAIGKKGQNVRLAAKLLGWKIDIKSEEEKRQEVEQQMQAMSGGPSTPIEQVTELGEQIIQKLVVAGITTVEALADMTPEQLEEIPGIGEKTLEKISLAVRHYFGEYEPGEERPAAKARSEEEQVEKARAIEDAQVAEELDALTLDQEGERETPDTEDGSGRISDDVARMRLEELTESGPDLDDIGGISESPGREDTSATLASHVPNYEIARSETVDEGNVEEASQESKEDAKVDEGST
jgi:transcription termination/antitermination protein NusA